MISIKKLSFSFFNTSGNALDDIDLDIPARQFVAITGPSGCGKSTLSMAIGGYIPHVFEGNMSGSVTIGGRLTTQMTLTELATHVGIVQQDPESQLCTLNVADEVSFGPENLALPPDEVTRRVNRSLSMVGASHLKYRHVYELSGGEKQRVAIASILAMEPDVLILDEPTSNLDPSSTTEVLKAIGMIKESSGMTIIVIEHKLDKLMGLADRLIVMDNGKIVLDGRPDEVIGKYKEQVKGMRVRLPHRCSKIKSGESIPKARTETIRVENLRFSYDTDEVLHGISFKAYRSEMIGVIGPNGSGKTTFMLHLLGLNRPVSGTIRVLGKDISGVKTSEIARKIGYVFQNPNHQICEKTVRDEAAFACKNFKFDDKDTEELVSRALKKYGLITYEEKHPLGLSFGEKRRLNLCSILPHGPEIIVLDEPFVGQDYTNVIRMITELEELKREGKTIILVSHDIDMVYKHCDRIVMFDAGNIVVDDTPERAIIKIRASGAMDFIPGGEWYENEVRERAITAA